MKRRARRKSPPFHPERTSGWSRDAKGAKDRPPVKKTQDPNVTDVWGTLNMKARTRQF
jgi:hypothetical protein